MMSWEEEDLGRVISRGYRVEGRRSRGRPKQSLEHVVRKGLRTCGIDGILDHVMSRDEEDLVRDIPKGLELRVVDAGVDQNRAGNR